MNVLNEQMGNHENSAVRRMRGGRKTVLAVLCLLLFLAGLGFAPVRAAASGKISLNCRSLLLSKGQSYRLKLRNAGKTTWKSSNKKVVSVNTAGKVKAKKAGSAVITAVSGKKKYTCSVTVSDGKKDTLVVFFSATGTTKKQAKKVKKAAQADMIQLLPAENYTAADLDYDNDDCRATREQNQPSARPEMATVIRNLSQYKTIYLGYPIWWGQEPRLIRTFLDRYSMKGRTVIPFCTSGSSGISGSMPGIRKGAKGASVLDGKDLTGLAQKKVTAWVRKMQAKAGENNGMKMKIGNREVKVQWEKNASVNALAEMVRNQPLTVQMSMYGGFEQVGSLGKRLPSSDKYTTTAAGDIVLYEGDQIVVFYGANSWEYTRLGKITGVTADEMRELLGNGAVIITLNP